jgi:hypothetical protein
MAGAKMNGARNKGERGATRHAVVAAVAALALCLPSFSLMGQQRPERSRPAQAPHYSAPRQQQQTHPESPRRNEPQSAPRSQAPQYQRRPAPQYQPREPQYPNRSAQPQYQPRTQQYQNQLQNRGSQPQYQPNRPPGNGRPQFQRPPQNPYAPQGGAPQGRVPQTGSRGPAATPQYNAPGYGRRPSPGTAQQLYAPPGHLGSWLNNHKNTPVPQQEQMLRNDPSFRGLPQGEQQRVMNQLNQVNRMPETQRERRLARAENLERLSPEERARVAQSSRQWRSLPQDRQSMMRTAI